MRRAAFSSARLAFGAHCPPSCRAPVVLPRAFSSDASASMFGDSGEASRPRAATLSDSPTGEDAPGTFFELDDYKKHFPRGLQDSDLETMFTRLGGRPCLMVRPPALAIIDAMRSASSSPGARLFYLDSDGVRGTGKTSQLLHAVHYARHSGWLVLHIPRGRDLVSGGLWVEEGADGLLDQPHVAQQLPTAALLAY